MVALTSGVSIIQIVIIGRPNQMRRKPFDKTKPPGKSVKAYVIERASIIPTAKTVEKENNLKKRKGRQ